MAIAFDNVPRIRKGRFLAGSLFFTALSSGLLPTLSSGLLPTLSGGLLPTLSGGWLPAAVAEQRALLADGELCTGQITGKNPATLAFSTSAGAEKGGQRSIPLASVRQITLASPPRFLSATVPRRQIVIRGGERLHVGWESLDRETVAVSAFGMAPVLMPRAALSHLLQPADGRVVVYEDFEHRPTLFDVARLSSAEHRSGRQSLFRQPGDATATFNLPARMSSTGISEGRIELSFYDTGAIDPSQDWFVEIEIQSEAGRHSLQFRPGWSGTDYSCMLSGGERLAAQAIARTAGWHRFAILFGPRAMVVLVDERVVATGSRAGEPTAIRFRNADSPRLMEKPLAAEAGIPKANLEAQAWVDDLQIVERVDRFTAPSNTQPNDLVWLASGDELYGQMLSADPRTVRLSGKFGARRIPWGELNGAVFAVGNGPPGTPVAGVVATIELAPIPGAGEADRIVAAIERANEGELIARHPYLGALRIPLREVGRIVPQFCGTLIPIDPAHHHLGDEIREEFTAKLAEGPLLVRSFMFEAQPRGKVYVSLSAADLEPAVSPNEGFRRELAAGRLRTELFINDRRVTDLNQFLSWRALPENPARLRVAVPAALLKSGENTLRIEQRPLGDDPQELDDCEISRLAIEIDPVTR